jgi:signal transduction histidine kinase
MTRFCRVFRASCSASMQFATCSLAALEKQFQLLDSVLDRGDQAIAEGRDAVQGLRSSTVIDSDLIQRLTVLAEELAAPRENQALPTFRLLVEGRPAT